jgi:glycosyltransferase involved in cell wall biosynthesis
VIQAKMNTPLTNSTTAEKIEATTLDFPRYVLLTAAYNEEPGIARIIESVVAQTHRPKEWVIVDDGSTDGTLEILRRYAQSWPFIHVVARKKEKSVGHNWAARVDAINYAGSQLSSIDYQYIGILDADITLEPNYYQSVVARMTQRPQLGVAGGNLYERQNGQFRPRPGNRSFHVPGAVQLFRRECYEKVGGLKAFRGGHDDTVAEITARMYGWKSESFDDLPVYHHRPTGITGTTVLRARFSEGSTQYCVGYHPLFQFFNCLRRIGSRPYVAGAAARLAGYWVSALSGEQRHTSPEFIAYLQKEQLSRIKSLFWKPAAKSALPNS